MPIQIPVNKRIFGHYDGLSFFIVIFYYKHCCEKEVLLHHEKIHFYQQLELLFVVHWLLYILFYLLGRIRGKSHDQAYRLNAFEQEAYAYEYEPTYLKRRRLFAWRKFL